LRIFGPKRNELIGGWSKLYNGTLHNIYSLQNIIRMEEKGNSYRILVGKPEGRRPLERPRRGWMDNIIIDLRERVWSGMDRIHLAQYRGQ
jgi:hypothetical protein